MVDTPAPTAVRRTVSVPEAARMLGIGRSLAFDLARRGELPGAIRLGGRTVVSVSEIERALRGGREEQT